MRQSTAPSHSQNIQFSVPPKLWGRVQRWVTVEPGSNQWSPLDGTLPSQCKSENLISHFILVTTALQWSLWWRHCVEHCPVNVRVRTYSATSPWWLQHYSEACDEDTVWNIAQWMSRWEPNQPLHLGDYSITVEPVMKDLPMRDHLSFQTLHVSVQNWAPHQRHFTSVTKTLWWNELVS